MLCISVIFSIIQISKNIVYLHYIKRVIDSFGCLYFILSVQVAYIVQE